MKADVEEWIESARAQLTRGSLPSYFCSIHLDDLLGDSYVESSAVRLGVETLVLCSRLVSRSDGLAPRLAVALPASPTLDTALPNLDEINQVRDTLQPPELYIFARNLEYLSGGHEEYRVGVSRGVSLEIHSAPRIEVSYTVFRDEVSRRNGWEFSRTLWFDIS